MTRVLGLYDWHNCGAAIVEDGRIVAAVEEERLSRAKVEFGFPSRSIRQVMNMTGTKPADLDAVAVCGIYDPTALVRWRQSTFRFERKINLKWRLQYELWRLFFAIHGMSAVRRVERGLNRRIILHQIREEFAFDSDRLHFVDHHLCHASVGYRCSGFDEALVFAIDGSGDGYSTTMSIGRDGRLRLLAGAKERASLGKFYANATLGLGWRKLTGEGKLMGLAAHGDPSVYYPHLEHVLHLRDPETLDFVNGEDLVGNRWALKLRRDLERFSREDIAAAVQQRFEDLTLSIIDYHVSKRGIRNVVIVGGAAMNVRMNQRVRELPGVDATFVFPAMTDSGVGSGAALEICDRLMRAAKRVPSYGPLPDAYLGPEYADDEIRATLERRGYGERAEAIEDIDLRLADLVVDGAIVARFTGRMEYGPRALGNRSIVALATRDDIEEILDKRLGRDEFMPFAPSILEEHAGEYLVDYRYSPFMIETFDIKPEYRQSFPPIVHVDGTVRPQVVRRQAAPGYWRLIERVGNRTGFHMVLNTSYNIHGEPIVCSPDDALNTFEYGCVDYLAMGRWLLKCEPQDVKRKREHTDEG